MEMTSGLHEPWIHLDSPHTALTGPETMYAGAKGMSRRGSAMRTVATFASGCHGLRSLALARGRCTLAKGGSAA